MFRSRLFGFAAVTLCLLAFVSAHGEGSKRTAKEKVKEAKKLTDKVLMNVQQKYRSAEDIKEKVESGKTRAESAAKDAKTAAKDNAEAVAIAEKANTAVTEYLKLYPSAKVEAEKAFDTADKLRTKARQLDNKAQKMIVTDSGSEEEYTQLISNADAFIKEAKEIEENINEATALIGTAEGKLWPLTTHAKNAIMAKYQVDAIVKVAEIETMLSKADEDIKVIEQKENEVNATVEAIKQLFKNISDEVFRSSNRFLNNAESDLSRITNSVKKAKQSHEEMLKQKNDADKALKEIKTITDESETQRKLENINLYAKKAATPLKTISEARQSAVTHAEYANNRKTKAEKEIAEKNSKPNGEDGKTAEKPQTPTKEEEKTKPVTKGTGQIVEDKQEPPAKHEPTKQENKDAKQISENKPEQSVNNAPMKPTDEETNGPVEKRPNQSVNNEPTTLAKQSTEQTVESDQEQPVKDEPTKQANNETKQTVESEPAKSVNNEPTQGVTQGTWQTVEDNQEPPVKHEPLKRANKGTEHTAKNVPEQSVKDKIKTFVSNEVLSTSDVINDNAITATVSLPLALIVFAALYGGY